MVSVAGVDAAGAACWLVTVGVGAAAVLPPSEVGLKTKAPTETTNSMTITEAPTIRGFLSARGVAEPSGSARGRESLIFGFGLANCVSPVSGKPVVAGISVSGAPQSVQNRFADSDSGCPQLGQKFTESPMMSKARHKFAVLEHQTDWLEGERRAHPQALCALPELMSSVSEVMHMIVGMNVNIQISKAIGKAIQSTNTTTKATMLGTKYGIPF